MSDPKEASQTGRSMRQLMGMSNGASRFTAISLALSITLGGWALQRSVKHGESLARVEALSDAGGLCSAVDCATLNVRIQALTDVTHELRIELQRTQIQIDRLEGHDATTYVPR